MPEMIFRPIATQEIKDMRYGVVEQIRDWHSVFPVVRTKFHGTFVIRPSERTQADWRYQIVSDLIAVVATDSAGVIFMSSL
jgi:hypothetical protein